MKGEEDIVNALWIGKELSALEMLTLHSFVANGHRFRLWLYNDIINTLPAGVEVCDASTIIPAENVFAYRNQNSFGHGKGSYAGFSDIFRYKLLYEHGGWWVDMDVTCLRPLNLPMPYVFRNHHDLMVVGNVMRCPKKSELMKACYQQAVMQVTADNTDWHKPIDILNQNIKALKLEQFIVKDISNHDKWLETRRYFSESDELPSHWYFIHWQNEELRAQHISKNDFYFRSAVAKLASKYGLFKLPVTTWQKVINTIQHSEFIRVLIP
ncbi:MAG TPA: glycosyltransferase [Chitinophagales bacterium]|nr:glycosyltransferase [Chitinophagales bacterium]